MDYYDLFPIKQKKKQKQKEIKKTTKKKQEETLYDLYKKHIGM